LEIAHAAAKLPLHPLAVQVSERADSSAPPSYYVPSIERARRELGVENETEFPAALARTFRWHQKQSSCSDTLVRV
jgi:nucleoside-diphosphate-sugar epimerase